jgi:hypothetical protein
LARHIIVAAVQHPLQIGVGGEVSVHDQQGPLPAIRLVEAFQGALQGSSFSEVSGPCVVQDGKAGLVIHHQIKADLFAVRTMIFAPTLVGHGTLCALEVGGGDIIQQPLQADSIAHHELIAQFMFDGSLSVFIEVIQSAGQYLIVDSLSRDIQ